MQFFEDENGNHRPISVIKRIGQRRKKTDGRSPHEAYVRQVDLVDGSNCQIDEWQFTRLERNPVHMFAAQSGTFVLGPPGEEGTDDVAPWRTPVIAWGVGWTGIVYPYTADGADDGVDNPGPVLFPDGMVTQQALRSWRNEADWIAWYRRDKVSEQAADTDSEAK